MRASSGYGKVLGNGELVKNAWKARQVVPTFNVPYLPMIEPIVQALIELDAFAFIATAPVEWQRHNIDGPKAVTDAFARCAQSGYVRLHLDHVPAFDRNGNRFDCLPILRRAIEYGFSSVMVDASALPFEVSIEVTAAAVETAHAVGVACEAELGPPCLRDPRPLPTYEELVRTGRAYTVLEEARRFVAETGCDWLTVSVGNRHGALNGIVPEGAALDIDHLRRLKEATGVPLVLHGAGMRGEDIIEAIPAGVAKVNIAAALRRTYEEALRETNAIPAAQEAVQEHVGWLLLEYFAVSGMRPVILGDL